MALANVYLTFNGNCRQAFSFYKSVFGGDFTDMHTFGEMPPHEGVPPVSDTLKNNIMHVSLPISKETRLMGSDSGGESDVPLKIGNNFSISINTDDKEEAEQIFYALAKDGDIKMPLAKTFWNAYFGMLTDKFGINWMVNCDIK